MNQILSTSMGMENRKKNKEKKVRTSSSIEIGSILKFFGVAILVFGIVMIGSGVYSIYKNQAGSEEENLEPTISIENKTETSILLKVMHQKVISKVEYNWNDNQPIVLSGNNGTYLDQEITLPSGKNTLHVLVQDIDGNEVTYDKDYDIASNINFEVSGNKIKVTYEADTMISYMTYRWDDEEETTIDINDKKIEQEIDAKKGIHELRVVVVDVNNNTDTKVQKINGVSKPKVTVELDEEKEHFVIIASDDEKLTMIEMTLDQDDNEGQSFVLNLESFDMKEIEYTLKAAPFTQGDNILRVTVYNSNGITESVVASRYVR